MISMWNDLVMNRRNLFDAHRKWLSLKKLDFSQNVAVFLCQRKVIFISKIDLEDLLQKFSNNHCLKYARIRVFSGILRSKLKLKS